MKQKTRAAILLLFMCLLFLGGCGTDDIDISGYRQDSVALVGLPGGDTSVTIEHLKELDCITKKTHSTSDKIGEVRATGPLLETLLEEYQVSQKDFSKIKIYGKDDYDITLSRRVLEEEDIILAFGIDGEPLHEEAIPIRIIIPESDSAYWIRMVEKIEFIK